MAWGPISMMESLLKNEAMDVFEDFGVALTKHSISLLRRGFVYP